PEAMKKFQDAQATLGGALGRLMAVVQRYPDIKSGQNFLALQSELSGTENRIAIARRDYIQSVRAFNTEITTIPGRWWKAILYPQAKEMAAFDIPAEDQKVPKVDFSKPSRRGALTSAGMSPMAGAASATRSWALRDQPRSGVRKCLLMALVALVALISPVIAEPTSPEPTRRITEHT